MTFLDFGREATSNPAVSTKLEWLVTNGIGGYASGTVANLLTRSYHGLLVAALNPPLGRTLLLSKFDEMAMYDSQQYALSVDQWNSADAPLDPPSFLHLERFRLEGTTPVWTYAISDARLEKRVWMEQGANTTYVRYDLVQATRPLHLEIKALVNYRDFHGNTHAGDWHMQVELIEAGLKVSAFHGATPLYLLCDRAEAFFDHEWYRNYFHSEEAARGLNPLEDNLYVGRFTKTLYAGDSVVLVASTEPELSSYTAIAHLNRRTHEARLITECGHRDSPDWVKQLVLAADQFIVQRAVNGDPFGQSVIAGYHWFGDWGRDTMISLPGLTLATGRHKVAAKILRTFARYVDQGMLPNRFPDDGETPEYNTVDATLWYFNAVKAYFDVTHDDTLLQDLYPVLQEIIEWHQRGTRYSIHVDPYDGLLYAGEAGVQLTWMDAKIGDWVVTPRTGKTVEVNALWYNAVRTMADFARQLNRQGNNYSDLADRIQSSFNRFWNEDSGYCYDVIDAPESSHDASLRPNQLLAVSLPHSPLAPSQQRAIVDVCGRRLLTSLGMRSLAPGNLGYSGRYRGDVIARDTAYHQGTVWAWLIGPFIEAHLRVYHDPEQARAFLQPFIHHLAEYGVGSICEVAEGDPPHLPRGCIAQAWSVAEVLRAWTLIVKEGS